MTTPENNVIYTIFISNGLNFAILQFTEVRESLVGVRFHYYSYFRLHFHFIHNSFEAVLSVPTGFIHFFRGKIPGLFKVFPGPYFEISRIFQSLCRNAKKWELELIMETYTGDGYSRCPYDSMYHGVIREHWERINKFLYCLHLPSILQKVVWSAVKHLSTFNNKKNNNKNKYKYFKTRPRNWTPEIQVFTDANETCRDDAF